MFEPAKDGIRVRVRLQPKAGANRIDGIDRDADDNQRLRVRVTEAPEKGRANKALSKLLAKAWRLAPTAVEVVAGQQSRDKTILVRTSDAEFLRFLTDWARTLAGSGEAASGGDRTRG